MCPCRAFYEFFFFDQTFGAFLGGDIGLLRDPTFPANKTHTPSYKARHWNIKHGCKFQGLSLKNAVDIGTFSAVEIKNHGLPS